MFSQIVEVHKCVLGSGFAQPTDWGHAMSWVCGASGGTVRCEHRHRRHPGRMRTISIPGERLLKDSDSRNNKGGRIAGVLIRVHYHNFDFPLWLPFLAHAKRQDRCELALALGQCAVPTLPGLKTLNWAWARPLVGGVACWCLKPGRLEHSLSPSCTCYELQINTIWVSSTWP